MADRDSSASGEATGEALAKINNNLGQVINGIWGARWALRFGALLPGGIGGLLLYGGLTTHKGPAHAQELISGFILAAIALGILAYSVLGDLD